MPFHWKVCRPPAGSHVPAGKTPPGTVVYAIGDIHGRCDLLESIHRGISIDVRMRPAHRRVIIYLGDYVSRGVNSRRVVDAVREPRRFANCEIVTLKGNHEDLLLRFLEGDLEAGRHWFDYDGLDALRDYGVPVADRQGRDNQTLESLRGSFSRALPEDHLRFFRALKASHREGGYYFVHGGIRPGVALDAQRDNDRMWIRKEFLESEIDHGAVVVHGHSIVAEPEVRHNRIGIDTGAYASGVLTCLVLDGVERSFLQT